MTRPAGFTQRLLRADWLRELQLVLSAGLLLSIAGLIVAVAMAIYAPLSVAVPAGHVVTGDPLHGLTGGAEFDPSGDIDLRVAQPTAYQSLLGILAFLPTGLVVLTMVAVLLRLVRDARRTDPFTAATVRRLRRLGAVVVIGGLTAWVVEFCARFALAATVTDTGPGATLNLVEPLAWLLVGFGFLAVAEVVNRGQALRAELDQVI